MPEGLEQLRDIHLPEALPWWKFAPGFGLLAILLLLAAGLLAYFFYRTRHARRIRKQALYELAGLEQAYLTHLNVSLTAGRISVLLKQVALMVYPRASVAALQGEEWLAFLEQTSKKIPLQSVKHLLLHAPFCAEYHESIDPLFTVAKTWIKQRRKLWLN